MTPTLKNNPNAFYTFPVFSIAHDPNNPNDRGCTNLTIMQLTNNGSKKIRIVERQYYLYKYYYKFVDISMAEFNIIALRIGESLNIFGDAILKNRDMSNDMRLSQNRRMDANNAILNLETEYNIILALDTQVKSDMAKFYKNDLPVYDIYLSKPMIAELYHMVEYIFIVDKFQQQNSDYQTFDINYTPMTISVGQNNTSRVIPLLMKLSKFFNYHTPYIPEMEMQ